MQWLFSFESEWLEAVRQSPWFTRAQVLLSAGLGLSGLAMYFAGECLRRLPLPVSARSRR